MLSTHPELIRRALMWLQRKYISNEFPNYDPTSDRDDDLPLDLDHLIPQNVFGFDWRWRDNRLAQEGVDRDNFRAERRTIGNSLGNYRWLTARDNRERQDGEIDKRPNDADLNEEWEPWNALINTATWQSQDVSSF